MKHLIFTALIFGSLSAQASSYCKCDERYGADKIVIVVGKSDPDLMDSEKDKYVLNEYLIQPGEKLSDLGTRCTNDIQVLRKMGICK